MAALQLQLEQRQQQQQQDEEDDDSKQHHQQGVVVVDVDNNTNTNNMSMRNSSGSKAPRLPRWTRQEILVLIQGKKVAENRVRRGRVSGSVGVEPKWATVSSYCKRHGVNRGAVQCRKRWSNLAGDFKKIKDWESRLRDDSDSFWLMRNDLRRDRKLPGFFDREVYDILDGTSSSADDKQQPPSAIPDVDDDDDDVNDNDVNDNDNDNDNVNVNVNDDDDDILQPPPTTTTTTTTSSSPILFDSSRSVAADDAMFSSDEPPNSSSSIPTAVAAAAIPLSAKQYYEPGVPVHATPPPPPPPPGGAPEKQPSLSINPEIGSTSQGERKRRRLLMEHNHDQPEDELAQVLDKNGRILSAHLEAHNLHLKLDREQRNHHATGVISVLNKLADALSRIADKL